MKRIKSDHTTNLISLIAVDARALPGDGLRTLKTGCDDYIDMPMDLIMRGERLETCAREFLRQ